MACWLCKEKKLGFGLASSLHLCREPFLKQYQIPSVQDGLLVQPVSLRMAKSFLLVSLESREKRRKGKKQN